MTDVITYKQFEDRLDELCAGWQFGVAMWWIERAGDLFESIHGETVQLARYRSQSDELWTYFPPPIEDPLELYSFVDEAIASWGDSAIYDSSVTTEDGQRVYQPLSAMGRSLFKVGQWLEDVAWHAWFGKPGADRIPNNHNLTLTESFNEYIHWCVQVLLGFDAARKIGEANYRGIDMHPISQTEYKRCLEVIDVALQAPGYPDYPTTREALWEIIPRFDLPQVLEG